MVVRCGSFVVLILLVLLPQAAAEIPVTVDAHEQEGWVHRMADKYPVLAREAAADAATWNLQEQHVWLTDMQRQDPDAWAEWVAWATGLDLEEQSRWLAQVRAHPGGLADPDLTLPRMWTEGDHIAMDNPRVIDESRDLPTVSLDATAPLAWKLPGQMVEDVHSRSSTTAAALVDDVTEPLTWEPPEHDLQAEARFAEETSNEVVEDVEELLYMPPPVKVDGPAPSAAEGPPRPTARPDEAAHEGADRDGDVAPMEGSPQPGAGPARPGPGPAAPQREVPANPAILTASDAMAAGVALVLGTLAAPIVAFFLWRLCTAAALFTRLNGKKALQNPIRAGILAVAEAEPGVPVSELATKLSITVSTVLHHIRLLERTGHVDSRRSGRTRHVFPAGKGVQEKRAAMVLHHEKGRRILEFVCANPGTMQREIASGLGIGQSLAYWHLVRLEDAGLVRTQRVGRARLYRPITTEKTNIAY